MENLAIIIFTIFMLATIISAVLFIIGLVKKDFKFKPSKKVIGICLVGFVGSLFFYGAVQTPETKARIEAENKANEEKEAQAKVDKEEKAEKEALKSKEKSEEASKEQKEKEDKEQAEKDKKAIEKAEKEALAKKEQEEQQKKESEKKEEVKKEENNKDEIKEDKKEFNLKHGNLLSSIVNEDVLIIKAKIEPSLSNKTTISQNGFNVEDVIKNQGGDKFKEIQYWAVADMQKGEENKVISFTLNEKMIKNIKDGNMPANAIIDNAEDVYILPSLQK